MYFTNYKVISKHPLILTKTKISSLSFISVCFVLYGHIVNVSLLLFAFHIKAPLSVDQMARPLPMR